MGHVGECTLHARECGAGVGVFFLVQRSPRVQFFVEWLVNNRFDKVRACFSYGSFLQNEG
ncbi:unnamed protein product [Ectocarpus sp. 6 AP-2014]